MPTDLELARAKSSIDVEALTNHLRNRRQREIRNRILPIIANDPVFDKSKLPFFNHSQHLINALQICKRLLELRDAHSWSKDELYQAMALRYDSLPITLHEGAFISVIETQGTEEQKAFWLPKCHSYEVVGCYAQTEIAHGSNVQGLETKARYDPALKGLIVSSPRLESSKWWIGGLGVLANHAVVQAILEIPTGKGDEFKSHGPHLFIVPVRAQRTHEPLPGVTVGDIGPKAYGGFRAMDHGYLHLSNVRIPLSNMLMRHAKLTEDGEYKPAKHDKLSYGSMIALRSGMPEQLGWSLARAATIAIRYCIGRRQFSNTASGEPEMQVLEYASTKYRLYPLLAQAYAHIFAGKELTALYQQMVKDLTENGDVTLLPEVHILSTALKVKSTWDCVHGMEEARKACGGHGYSYMSGVGHIFANSAPSQTFEGDNYVISQQVSRSLLKNLAQLRSGSHQLPETSLYLESTIPQVTFETKHSKVKSLRDWHETSHQLEALQHRAAWLVLGLAESVTAGAEKGWTTHSWTSSKIAAAHADVYIVSAFRRSVSSFNGKPKMKKVLDDLFNLYILYTLVAALPELFESGSVDRVQARLLRDALEGSVEAFSIPAVVGLTDAFGFTDSELDSVLGKEDGKVYEEMWRKARETDIGQGENKDEIRKAVLDIVGHSTKTEKAKL